MISLLAFVLSLGACSSKSDPEKKAIEGFGQVKTNPVFNLTAMEIEKEILPGKKTVMWTYNAQNPGPTLHANVGDTVTIHFHNRLPVPSTIHWHGMEVPAGMDGSPLSQRAVPPGGSFTYRFRVNRAATYWYHSHINNYIQIEKGLHGGLIVHDPEENALLGLPKKEMNLILDDIWLDENNQVIEELPSEPIKRAAHLTNGREGNVLLVNGSRQPVYKVKEGEPLRLRFVNVANARFMRISLPGQIIHRIGGDTGLLPEPLRIREIKTISDPVKPIRVSDSDPSQGLMLSPGERAEITWVPKFSENSDLDSDESQVNLEWHDYPRGRHVGHLLPDGIVDLLPDSEDGRLPRQVLATFRIYKNPDAFKSPYELPRKLRASMPISLNAVKNTKPLKVTFGHGPGDKKGNVMFFATALMDDMDHMSEMDHSKMKHSKNGKMEKAMGKMGQMSMTPLPMMKVTNETALNAEVGETRIIEVKNLARGIHPFHMHGFPFELIETEYVNLDKPDDLTLNRVVKNTQRNWRELKDTFRIPGRSGYRMRSWTIMRFLVSFEDENRAGTLEAYGGKFMDDLSGGWLVHCHILEHAAFGMATWLNLWPKDKTHYH